MLCSCSQLGLGTKPTWLGLGLTKIPILLPQTQLETIWLPVKNGWKFKYSVTSHLQIVKHRLGSLIACISTTIPSSSRYESQQKTISHERAMTHFVRVSIWYVASVTYLWIHLWFVIKCWHFILAAGLRCGRVRQCCWKRANCTADIPEMTKG